MRMPLGASLYHPIVATLLRDQTMIRLLTPLCLLWGCTMLTQLAKAALPL